MAHCGAFWRTGGIAGDGDDWGDRQGVEVDGTLWSAGLIITYSSYDNWELSTSVATYAGTGYTMTLPAPFTDPGTVTDTHVYTAAGTYTAEVILTDSGGAVATDTLTITVTGSTPTLPAPTSLTATAASDSEIDLAWPDVTNEAGFTIQRSFDGATGWTSIGTTATGVTAYQDVGLAAATAYFYRVEATHAGYTSTWSATASATTPSATTLAGPSDLTATALDDEDVQLAWTPNPSDPNTQFEVDRQNADGSWTTLDTVDDTVDGDIYYDTGLSGATTYAYRVRTVGPTASSAYTDPVSVTTPLTTPGAPTGLSATEDAPGEVDLTFSEDSPIVTGFVVTATPLGGGSAITFPVDGDIGAVAATGLTPDVVYSFAVTADNNQGIGHDVQSAASTALTAVAPSAALSVTAPATVNEGASFTVTVASALPGGGTSPIASWGVTYDDGSTADTVAGPDGAEGHTPAAGVGEVTATVTATDAAGHTFTLPAVQVIVVPTAPTGVIVTAQTETDILVSWQNATSITSSSVVVLRSDDGGVTYNPIATVDASTTSYDDTGLTASTSYVYELESQATDGSTTSTPVSPSPTPTPTTTPSGNVTLTAVGEEPGSRAVLKWTYQGGDASGFELEGEDTNVAGQNFSLDMEGCGLQGPVGTDGTGTTTIGGLVEGDTYNFRIRADKTDGTVSAYGSASVTPGSDLNAPSVAYAGNGNLNISYPGGDATGFFIEWRGLSAPGPGWQYYDVNDYPYSWDINQPGTQMTPSGGIAPVLGGGDEVRIEAQTPEGMTPWSAPASIPAPAGDLPKPQVQATVVSDTEIDVTVTGGWIDPTEDTVGYTVYLADVGGGVTASGSWGHERFIENNGWGYTEDITHTFPLGGLTPGKEYYITAVSNEEPDDSILSSAFTDEIALTTTGGDQSPPAAPDGLKAAPDPKDGKKVDLSWHNNSNNEDGFDIYVFPAGTKFDPNNAEYIGGTKADKTTFVDNAPKPVSADGKPMDYAVVAFKGFDTFSKPAIAPVPAAWSIFVLTGDNSGNPIVDAVHESVAVGWTDLAGKVHILQSYSFGVYLPNGGPLIDEPAEHSWLGYKMNVPAGKYLQGKVYSPTFKGAITKQKSVTAQQAQDWKTYMDTRVGTPDYYSVLGLSCITFSEAEYKNAPDKKP